MTSFTQIQPLVATPPVPSRMGSSGSAITIILVLLVGFLIATFAVMTGKQAELDTEREATRLLRMTRQAMMEVDLTILDILARREQADMSRYFRATNKLAHYTAESFPPTVNRSGMDVPSGPVIASLKDAWTRIVEAAQTGQHEAARSVYVDFSVSTTMSLFVDSAVALIDEKDAANADLQREIRFAIAAFLCALLLIALLVYRAASQRSARDRSELQSAIVSANAARESATSATVAANASREQVSQLFQMTDMLQSASDHQDANAVLRATAAELIPDYGGALYVFSNSRDRLMLSTSWNREGGSELPDTIGLQQCWSLKRGKAHINVPHSHKLCCEHVTSADCLLEIPMIARGEILGLLQIFAPGEDGEARLQSIMGLGSALADGMSLALSNIALRDKLRGQALRDPLTGLYNRRYMEDMLERVVRLAERERTEVSVIMIDLDHFKRLNDNFGHAKGDSVLRDASAILLNQLRETDIACRYGGEELIVVMPNCGLEQAAAKAERLRSSIHALSEPNGAQVSASMGVATVPSTSTAARDLLAHADAALYEAKQAGRNRVVMATRQPVEAEARAPLELIAAE